MPRTLELLKYTVLEKQRHGLCDHQRKTHFPKLNQVINQKEPANKTN